MACDNINQQRKEWGIVLRCQKKNVDHYSNGVSVCMLEWWMLAGHSLLSYTASPDGSTDSSSVFRMGHNGHRFHVSVVRAHEHHLVRVMKHDYYYN